MKAKDLIKVLNAVSPNSEVTFSIGRDQKYRDTCAKVELLNGDCLLYLGIDHIELYGNAEADEDGVSTWSDIVLKQTNYQEAHLLFLAGEYDKKYLKNK